MHCRSFSRIDPRYDPLSRRQSLQFPNGTETTYTYTPASELETLITDNGQPQPLLDYFWQYDAAGNREDLTERHRTPQVVHDYQYDALNRLTEALHGGTPADERYAYDPVGNQTPRATPWVFNAANRLTNDGTYTYTYDANGNLATRTAIASMEVARFTWDPQDQLTRIDWPTGGGVDYAYDALGRRIQKDFGPRQERYVYDQADRLLDYDGSNTIVSRYTHGPGLDAPWLVEWDQSGDGTLDPINEVWTYHADALGSITKLTDPMGTEVQAYTYVSFGRLLGGTWPIRNPFTFTAREWDAESTFLYYRARYYDPRIGRFLSEDPVHFMGGDINLYPYALNNPILFTDPTGQWGWVGAGVGAVAGGVGGYITGGGAGAVAGAVAGAAVGAVNPGASTQVGSAAGAAAASVLGQVVGNAISGNGLLDNFSVGAVIGAAAGAGVTAGSAAVVGQTAVQQTGVVITGKVTEGVVDGAVSGLSSHVGKELEDLLKDIFERICEFPRTNPTEVSK